MHDTPGESVIQDFSATFDFGDSFSLFGTLASLFATHHLRVPLSRRSSGSPFVLQSGQQDQVVAQDRQAHAGGVMLKSLKKASSQLKGPF